MKPLTTLLILGAFLLFVGAVVVSTVRGAGVECEICLDFQSGEVCRLGRGSDRAEALQAAQESACGGNASGMAELIACRAQEPTRTQCSGG